MGEPTSPGAAAAADVASGERDVPFARRVLEPRWDALRVLQEVSTRLMRAERIDELYERILDAAVALMRADHASLQMIDPATGELRLIGARSFTPEAHAFWERVRPSSRSACGAALRAGHRVVVPDVERCEWMAASDDLRAMQQTGIRAVQSTPLVSRAGAVLGMFSTHWRSVHEPAPDELRSLDVLARQAADLIDRMRAEEALRASEAQLRALVEPWAQAHWETDARGVVVADCPTWRAYTGQTVEQLLGHGWLDAVHPEDRARVERQWGEAVAAGRHLNAEFRLRSADGGWRWTNVRASPVPGPGGRVSKWVGMNVDVTERRRAEILSEALGAIHLVIHSSHDLAHVVETALREATAVLGTETAAVSLREGAAWIVRYVHGFPPGVIGSRMADDEEPHAALALREQRPLAIPDAWNDPRVNCDHMRRWNIRAVLVVPLIVRGEATGVVFFNDHRGPRALGAAEVAFGAKFGAALSLAIDNARLFAELREEARRKTEFLAVLSHELRNPLAPIRNSIALLDGAPAESATARRAKDVIRRQTDHLVRLVDDLLDLSRITHGKMAVQLATADVRDLVRRAYLDAKVLFDARGVELLLSDSPEPVWVEADAARFAQMLGNLLHNALKFTAPGGLVKVEVARRGGACEVSVKDDGRGFDPADVDRIFDPFEQATLPHESGSGLGLGLALVRRLATKHHGTVRARSDGPGRGAEFVLALPLVAAPAAAAGRRASAPGRTGAAPVSIVVVEDNEDAAATLADLLGLGGHCVTVASTGRAGIEAVASGRPDVVICDVGLPDVNGYDVIRAIRAAEGGKRVFAVALTGYAQPRDRDAALAAGYDAHLPKPPPLDELERLLAGVAARGAR